MTDEEFRAKLQEALARKAAEATRAESQLANPERPSGSAIVPLSKGLIENYLRREGLRFYTDQDGDLSTRFGPNEERDFGIEYFFTIQGDESEILELLGFCEFRVRQSEFSTAVYACNEWNKIYRMPKAYFAVREDGDSGEIAIQQSLTMRSGTHQAFIDEMCERFLRMGFWFWAWLVETYPSVRT